MKKPKVYESHTARTQHGHGDYYGTGVRQKMGTTRRDYIGMFVPPSNSGKPPKSLA